MVRCLVCGRMLKDRESIRLQIGPICLKKVKSYIPKIKTMVKNSEPEIKTDEIVDGQISMFDEEGRS